ncbi:hypothetical protein [Maliponia aquimaris]|uniref:Uncharacterized protein n=1 Tax=Maliponia aquimaris TaxID=1673631 RepID=A0A238L554_9RHOB|nr:hypothetical protein [Maliponia aquimaris]SMX50139.1 hypothetical protein MAA8898_04623 [Maliponia aquimaris]
MTSLPSLRTETLDRLQALGAGDALSPRAAATCTTLIDKLRAPVRIGLVGLPGAGKRALLNALAGDTLADPRLDVPTLEVLPGDRPGLRATLADSSLLVVDGAPTAALLRQRPVYLRLTSPAPGLAGRRLLLLATDDSAQDLAAGLRWAAPRVDILLWCSRAWHPAERQVWHAAPDSLRNHAVLLLTGSEAPPRLRATDDGFDTAFRIDPAEPGGMDKLRAHLADIIDEAATQDLHGAQLFLARHAAATHAEPAKEPTPPPQVVPLAAASRPEADPEARAELGRLLHLLRRAAEDLRQELALAADDPDRLLSAFEEVFETLAGRCADLSHLSDRWPDLGDDVAEARDLALLLRIEGGAGQVTDAARLLVQVRTGIEERLAA